MSKRKITDRAEFSALWYGTKSLKEIAEFYGAHQSSISNAARRFELRRRTGGSKRRFEAVPAQVEDRLAPTPKDVPGSPFWTFEFDGDVWETQGSWAGISNLAKEWGCMTALVTARWHKLKAAA